MITGNLYSLEENDLHKTIVRDVAHFQHKHGLIPTVVRVHPDNLDGIGKMLEFRSDGKAHRAKIIADKRQGKSEYTIEGKK